MQLHAVVPDPRVAIQADIASLDASIVQMQHQRLQLQAQQQQAFNPAAAQQLAALEAQIGQYTGVRYQLQTQLLQPAHAQIGRRSAGRRTS